MGQKNVEKSFIFHDMEWMENILDISEVGLWTMVTDHKMNQVKFYIDRTMARLLGVKEDLTPEACFEFWYRRINRGNYVYVNEAMRRILETDKLCEVQYTWNHPEWGDIPVRCAGRARDLGDGRVIVAGYHQNMNILDQMVRWPLYAGSEEIFEYNTNTRTALVYTERKLLYGDEHQLKDFPQCLVDNQVVHPDNREAFLQMFGILQEGGKTARCEVKIKNHSGEYGWFAVDLEAMVYESDMPGIILGRVQDISRQKELENAYTKVRRVNQRLLEGMLAYGEVDLTADKVMGLSGKWKEYQPMTQRCAYGLLMKRMVSETVKPEHREEFIRVCDREHLLERFKEGEHKVCLEYRRLMGDDMMRWVRVEVYIYTDPGENHVCALFCMRDIDRIKEMERRMGLLPKGQESSVEEQFERVLWAAGDPACLVDPRRYAFITANQAFFRKIGKTEEECIGKTCYELIYGAASPCTFCNQLSWNRDRFSSWANADLTGGCRRLVKTKLVEWEGRDALLVIGIDTSPEDALSGFDQEDGVKKIGQKILSGIYAMTEAPSLEEAMRRLLDILAGYYEADRIQIFLKREDAFGYYCACHLDEYGNPEDNGKLKRDMGDWLSHRRPNEDMDFVEPQDMIGESFDLFSDMETGRIAYLSVFPIMDGTEPMGYIVMFDRRNNRKQELIDTLTFFAAHEIGRRKDSDRLYYNIYHDSLTGLLNRGSYDEYRRQFRSDQISSLGVIAVDINDLKSVNDLKGTEEGDRLICSVANIIKKHFGSHKVFRLNGNEFDIVMENLSSEEFEQRTGALLQDIGGHDQLSTAVGRIWDDREKNLDWTVKQAGELMRIDKQKYYENKPPFRGKGRIDRIKEILLSIERGEFKVVLQPKVYLATGRCAGAEALVRYSSPKHEYVLPSRFIGILERENLIRYVDLYVMEECCRILEKWKREGRGGRILSFNFSRMTLLGEDIVRSVESIVRKYDVTPGELEIEVTESIGDLGRDVVYKALGELKRKGYRISLDDFGTKYSNLDILTDVEFDVLKLDKSLVDKLAKDKVSRQIVKHVIAMCRDMKIQTVAEGVEDSTQADYLTQSRCIIGQGYLYGKPMEQEAFEKEFA